MSISASIGTTDVPEMAFTLTLHCLPISRLVMNFPGTPKPLKEFPYSLLQWRKQCFTSRRSLKLGTKPKRNVAVFPRKYAFLSQLFYTLWIRYRTRFRQTIYLGLRSSLEPAFQSVQKLVVIHLGPLSLDRFQRILFIFNVISLVLRFDQMCCIIC